MPHFCGCGLKNSLDHILICKKGGYVAMRHNDLIDLNVSMQREVCRDVISEPSLLPIQTEEIDGTQADRAAPDVSSRGLWSTFERTFFDVRVLHPNAPSYRSSDLNALYRQHEQEKMRKYNARVISVERGSFTLWKLCSCYHTHENKDPVLCFKKCTCCHQRRERQEKSII